MAIDYATGTGEYFSDWENDGYALGQKTYFLKNILATREGRDRFIEIIPSITSGAPYAMWDCAKLLCDSLGVPDFVSSDQDLEEHPVCDLMDILVCNNETRQRMLTAFADDTVIGNIDILRDRMQVEHDAQYPPLPRYTAEERAAMEDGDPRKFQLGFYVFETQGRMLISPRARDIILGRLRVEE